MLIEFNKNVLLRGVENRSDKGNVTYKFYFITTTLLIFLPYFFSEYLQTIFILSPRDRSSFPSILI